jgi:antitoxin ParD1/3/4/toxin ParE1/3/4
MQMLADNPEVGHLRTDLAPEPLRFWTIYSYMIIYRPETSPLQIIRILHGARDIKDMLQRGE